MRSFGLPILGLIFSEAGLDGTDALLGNPGTIYPTGVYYRDSNDSEDPADMWSLLNPTTLSIEGLQNQGIGLDQLRPGPSFQWEAGRNRTLARRVCKFRADDCL